MAEADVKALAKADADVQYCLEAMQREQAETLSVLGRIWNPAPRDMYEEVFRLMELQPVPFTLVPASEPVQELQPESTTAQVWKSRANQPSPQKTSRKRKLAAKAKREVKVRG